MCPIILSLLFYAILTKHSFSKGGLNLQRKKKLWNSGATHEDDLAPNSNTQRNFKSKFSFIVLNNRYKCHFHFILFFFFIKTIRMNTKLWCNFWIGCWIRREIRYITFFISFEVWMNGLILWLYINIMAIRVVKFSNGGCKIRKIFAQE